MLHELGECPGGENYTKASPASPYSLSYLETAPLISDVRCDGLLIPIQIASFRWPVETQAEKMLVYCHFI